MVLKLRLDGMALSEVNIALTVWSTLSVLAAALVALHVASLILLATSLVRVNLDKVMRFGRQAVAETVEDPQQRSAHLAVMQSAVESVIQTRVWGTLTLIAAAALLLLLVGGLLGA